MGPKPIDRIGQQFGQLTVIAYAGHKKWLCQCTCGVIKAFFIQNLKAPASRTVSCGCYRNQVQATNAKLGGEANRLKNLQARQAETRECQVCHDEKPLLDFIIPWNQKIVRSCTICRKKTTTDQARTKGQIRRWALRLNIISHYGNACQCCGEKNPYFLQLDHINGGGTAERTRTKQKAGVLFYAKVKQLGYPDIYRILCGNCNTSFGHYGYCPHDHLNHPIAPEKPWQRVRWRVKLETFAHYGHVCQCCQEAFPEFLQIDHVNGRGGKQRGIQGVQWYRLLKKRRYPQKRYRLLCASCNSARGFFGLCPHTGEMKQLTLL